MLRFLVLLLALAAPVSAQEAYPRLHDVVDVAADDTLNVRAAPSSKAELVGELAHDARAVEVLRTENGWGLVNIEERTGWAYLRYLAPRAAGDLPNVTRLGCFGTEPFWGLDIQPGQTARLTSPEDMDGRLFQIGPVQHLYAPMLKYAVLGSAAGAGGDLSVVVTPAYCDDGMSDREYGLDVTVFVSGERARAYAGCCSLAD